MLLNCNNCTKEFEAKTSRSRFCSTKCKQAAFRNNPSQRSVTNVTQTPSSVTQTLTKTDQLFQQDVINRSLGDNWLSFSPIVRSPNCLQCGKSFKTQLGLLRYCSPSCKAKAEDVVLG